MYHVSDDKYGPYTTLVEARQRCMAILNGSALISDVYIFFKDTPLEKISKGYNILLAENRSCCCIPEKLHSWGW